MLDRVVADVDGQAILASDVDDEMRFSALLPGVEPAADNTPQRALNRVIDRTLIDQQRALQPGVAVVSQKDVEQAIAEHAEGDFCRHIHAIARPMRDGRHFWHSTDLRRMRFKIVWRAVGDLEIYRCAISAWWSRYRMPRSEIITIRC